LATRGADGKTKEMKSGFLPKKKKNVAKKTGKQMCWGERKKTRDRWSKGTSGGRSA